MDLHIFRLFEHNRNFLLIIIIFFRFNAIPHNVMAEIERTLYVGFNVLLESDIWSIHHPVGADCLDVEVGLQPEIVVVIIITDPANEVVHRRTEGEHLKILITPAEHILILTIFVKIERFHTTLLILVKWVIALFVRGIGFATDSSSDNPRFCNVIIVFVI